MTSPTPEQQAYAAQQQAYQQQLVAQQAAQQAQAGYAAQQAQQAQTQAHAAYAAPQAQQPPYTPQPGYGPASTHPRPAAVNPFAGVPLSDWIRDGAAVVLLLVSLALPWAHAFNYESANDRGFTIAATRIDVLLITLLSVLSVAVGYLGRAGAFGASFTEQRTALVRALLNVPYALLVLLYIIFDAVKFGDLADHGVYSGLGPAVIVGLSGMLFAAIPRRVEAYAPGFAPSAAAHGRGHAIGLLGFAGVTTLLGVILSFIGVVKFFEYLNGFVTTVSILLTLVSTSIPIVLLVLVVVRRSEAARLISLAAGIAMIVGTFISVFASQAWVETLWGNFGYPLLTVALLAPIMSHPGLPFAMRESRTLQAWHQTLRLAPVALIAVLGLLTLNVLLLIIFARGQNIGFAVGILVCAVLGIAVTLLLRLQLASNFTAAQTISAGLAGGLVVLGIATTVFAGLHSSDFSNALGGTAISLQWIVAYTFAVPGLIFFGLFAPAPVREYFAANRPQLAAALPYAGAAPTAVGVPFVAVPEPVVAPVPSIDPALLARAQDPTATAQDLFALTAHRELWPYIAHHPALYPDLASWLRQTGDPATLQVLTQRGM